MECAHVDSPVPEGTGGNALLRAVPAQGGEAALRVQGDRAQGRGPAPDVHLRDIRRGGRHLRLHRGGRQRGRALRRPGPGAPDVRFLHKGGRAPGPDPAARARDRERARPARGHPQGRGLPPAGSIPPRGRAHRGHPRLRRLLHRRGLLPGGPSRVRQPPAGHGQPAPQGGQRRGLPHHADVFRQQHPLQLPLPRAGRGHPRAGDRRRHARDERQADPPHLPPVRHGAAAALCRHRRPLRRGPARHAPGRHRLLHGADHRPDRQRRRPRAHLHPPEIAAKILDNLSEIFEPRA